MRFKKIIVLVGAIIFQPAFAQTMNSLNIDPGEKLLNQSIRVSIDFTSEKKPACGLRVNWGDGRSQTIRVGHDGEEGAPTSPINLDVIYSNPGKYNVEIKGEYLRRGLGSVGACDVKANVVTVAVIDPDTDQKYIEKSWSDYLSKLNPIELQCIRVGSTVLGIKYETITSADKLMGLNAPISKRLTDRCNIFAKAIHPTFNVPCKVSGATGTQDSMCDFIYAQKAENANLKAISVEDTIKLHVQGQPWEIGKRETQAAKTVRLAKEKSMLEKENQRLAEEQAQQEIEMNMRKEAIASFLAAWKDSGLEPSQLPICPPRGILDNCFGFTTDVSGNKLYGEFKNNALNGNGIILWKNGEKYIGQLKLGSMSGQGVYIFNATGNKNAGKQIGEFSQNKLQGFGIVFNEKWDVISSGLFENGALVSNRYVDPNRFSLIPIKNIPSISSAQKLAMENKEKEEQLERDRQSVLAEKQAEKERIANMAAEKVREREAARLQAERIADAEADLKRIASMKTNFMVGKCIWSLENIKLPNCKTEYLIDQIKAQDPKGTGLGMTIYREATADVLFVVTFPVKEIRDYGPFPVTYLVVNSNTINVTFFGANNCTSRTRFTFDNVASKLYSQSLENSGSCSEDQWAANEYMKSKGRVEVGWANVEFENQNRTQAQQSSTPSAPTAASIAFPFRAEFSCTPSNNGSEFGLFACLDGKYTAGTLEIQNGSDYSYFKSLDLIPPYPQRFRIVPNAIIDEMSAVLQINLNKNFSIKMYSPNDTFVSGLKIIDNVTNSVVWQKKIAGGWIIISNN